MFAFISAARKTVLNLFILTSLVFLSACIELGGNGGQKIDPNAPIPVALLVPRGSADANVNALAKDLENAARLAVSDLQGVKVDLRVYATAGNAQQAATVARQAVADGAKIIVGPLYQDAANAAAVAVLENNVNVLAFTNNTSIAGGNLFVLGRTFENTANRLVRYAIKQGRNRILVTHAEGPAGELGAFAVKEAVAKNGGILVGSVGYAFSQQSITSKVPQIVQVAQTTGAQALFTTADSAGELPLLTQLLPERGLSPNDIKYVGLTRWDVPAQALQLPGVQGGWFALPDPALTAQYKSRFNSVFGHNPHQLSSLAYDAVAAVGALVKSKGANALTTSALTQKSGFQGVQGVFRLLPDGTNERGLAIAQVQNNRAVIIDPAPRSFGGAGF